MIGERKRKLTGIGLIVVGALFLFVTNGILIGWRHIWPLFPVAGGVLLLRSWTTRHEANHLFAGLVSVILGAFLLLFSVGILDWTQMARLWPTIPIVVGGSMLAGNMVREDRGSMMLEIGLVLFGVVAFLFTTEKISPRVAGPFIRFWPLVLIVAGVVILKRHPGPVAGGDPHMDDVRAVLDAADDTPSVPPAPRPEHSSSDDRSPV